MSEHREPLMEQSPIPQQHKIMRQVLEVHGGTPEARQDIQSALRDTYYQRLLPLIETICSDVSVPDRIHRINRMEIELTVESCDALEAVLADPFEAAFRARLKTEIDDAPEIDADLELFDYFIRTGNVPWWANACEPNQLEASLNRLLERNPHALRRVLQTTAELPQVRRRIVRAYSDHILDALISILAPSMFSIRHSGVASKMASGVDTTWLTLLESVNRAQGQSRSATRYLWWEEVLRVSVTAEHTHASTAPRFYQTILTGIAQRLGSSYPLLITDLHSALKDAKVSVPSGLDEITNKLWQALDDEATQMDVVTEAKASDAFIDAVRADLISIMARLERGSELDTQLWTQLQAVIERLPADLKARVLLVYDLARESEGKSQSVKHSLHEKSKESKDVLISLLQNALGQISSSGTETGNKLDPLTDSQPHELNTAGNTLRADLTAILARLEQTPSPDHELWIQLRGVIERLPANVKTQVLSGFYLAHDRVANLQQSKLTKKDAAKLGVEHTRIENMSQSAKKTDKTETVSPTTRHESIDTDTDPASNLNHSQDEATATEITKPSAKKDALMAQLRSTLEQLPSANTNKQDPKQQIAIDSSFSEVDALYVGNAGLVILWPFLQPFFERLGLTEDKQFKDESSAQRGVGLLQYLASADESPAEILLPLNKILCGMAPEMVFDFGPEISAHEKQECDDLLKAVIHQVPILNEMSSAGFRASFLLRQGQLGTRDDNWLLRAERQTHDIVLDRFPWSVHIVKLPWMEAVMQVEW